MKFVAQIVLLPLLLLINCKSVNHNSNLAASPVDEEALPKVRAVFWVSTTVQGNSSSLPTALTGGPWYCKDVLKLKTGGEESVYKFVKNNSGALQTYNRINQRKNDVAPFPELN